MICIDAEQLQDGLYNIKDGKIYKYKANGGTVRAYKIENRPQGKVDAVEIYERAELQLERSEITIGKFEEIIEPLRHVFYGRPQEWIPCSEKEPNEFIDVLVCLTDGTMDVVQLTDYVDIDGEPKWCHSTDYTLGGAILNSDVVAWMPLPKPWEGVGDE